MNGLCFRVFGVRFVSILAAVIGLVMAVQAQVELDAIPAPVGGTVSVCAGSTVLFFNDTDSDLLYGETEFTWLLDGTPLSAEGSGPVAEVFDVPGTYELTLQIVTLGGTDILDPATLTVEVSAFPDVVPTLGPGNSCTIESVDPLTGLTTFQTQSGASCTCTNASMGPAIALLNTDQYPEGTVSRMHWGGPGSAANGGTAPYTDEFGPFPTTTPDLAQFAGQINPLGHYASQGSYNLIHEVIFPGGCVYTAYYVMSWGAAIIDLCGNSAQSVCVPLDYPLCFDSQDPGTTYHIDWGDGSEETFAYPNLPTAPNELTHSYPPSCTEIDGELVSQPYTLTITATNACNVLQTQNTQGPFYVSEAPVPQVSMSSSDDYCQYQEVTFTNSTTNTGTIASADGCSTEYTYSWFIVDTASIGPPIEGEDYVILEGFFGDWDDPQGSESITLEFDETGNYQVVLTASNLYCESQSAAVNIAIGETPVAVDTMLTICTGQGIAFTPSGPGVNLPDGTSLQWVLLETNPNITGAPQEGSSSDVVMELPTLENLTNALQSVTYQVTPLGPPPGLCLGHPFNVTVNVAPGITLPNSIDLTICSGDVAFLEPVNDPPDFILPDGTTFSWEYEDNDEVQGETAGEDEAFFEQELVLEGSLYEVVEYQVNASLGEVENGCGNALFDIQVHVHDVQPGTTGPDSTLCFGADAYEIGFEPDGLPAVGGTMTIDWYASDSPSGPWTLVGSGNTYLPPSPVVEATYYRAFVTSELNDVACTGFSSITSVELNVLEEINIGTNDTICAGDIPAEIALLGATDASWTYQWQNRPLDQVTWSDLEGSNAASVQPGPLSEDTEFRLLVMNEEGGITCPSVTNAVTIEVNSVVPGVLSSTQYLCEGQEPAALQVDGADGDGELTYVWVPSDGSGEVPAGPTYTPQVPITDISYAVEVTSTLGGTACSAATDPINLLLNRVSAGVPSDSVLMHCVGDDPGPLVFDEPPSADGELGLQWQFMDASGEWTNVPGATDLGFDPSDALLEELQFRVVATSDLDGVVCSDTSAVWQLLLNQVDGGSLLTDQSICAGGIPSPITSAGNSLAEYSATYAWVSAEDEEGPWVDVNEGPETPIFEPDALSADTWFALVVISTSGQVACRDTSDAVAVEVVPQPELYATSALSDTACVADVSDLDGLHDPFSVAYDFGTGDPTYTWYDDAGDLVQSSADATFMPPSSTSVGTYNYLVSLELTGAGCQPDTLADTLTYVVVGDPVVDSLLADASYCAGSTPLDLAVYMSGGHVEGAYDYAWYANGVDLEEGGATLTPDVSEVGDFYYYVEVTQTGAHCAVTSDSVLIEVEPGPTWTLQPEGVTVCAVAGSDVDLTVAFEGGAGDTTYTWHSSSTLEGPFVPEPMSDSATFVVSTEGPGLVYYYVELQLSGGCNAVLSDTVAVEVVPQPELYATSALSDTACVADVSDLDGLHDPFSVAYDFGTGDPTYTWYDDAGDLVQSSADATFMPPSSTSVGTYNYLVSLELTGAGCQPDTLADTLTYVVVGDPVVDSLFADASYCVGSTPLDLAVYVSGGHVEGAYDYAWYANGVDLEEGGATLTPDVSEVADFYYYVEVTQTGAHCAVTSDSVLIEVEPGPTWTLQPEGVTVCAEAGSDVDLTVAFEGGAGDTTYTWHSSSTLEGPFAPEPMSDSATLVVSTEGPGLVYYYAELQLSGGCNAVLSDTVAVEVVPQPELYATSALSDTACVADVSDLDGLHDPFSVAYDFGTGDPTYMWYDADWQPIQSATDSTFMPASSLEVGTYNYLVSVELTGSGCQSDTLLDTLTYVVVGDPVVDSLLADASYCVGSTPVDLAVYMSGGHVEGAYDYAWYANGVDLEEGGATLTPDVSEVGDFYYYVEVTQTGAHCAVTSDSVLVEVEPGPTWTLQPEGVTVCAVAGSDVDLSVAFEGGAGDSTYTWYSSSAFDGSYEQVNPLVDSSVYEVFTEVPGLTYYYVELQLDGGCDAIVSDTVAVGVNDIYPGTLFDNDTICSGEIPMDLEVVDLDWLETLGWAENVNLEFNWLESSTSEGPFSSVQNNPDASVYNPGTLLDTMWFAVEVSSIWNESACKDTTQVVEIVVNPLPVLSVIGDTICNNTTVEIPLAAMNFSNTELTYSWSAAYDEPDVDGEELTLQTLPLGPGPELINGPLENTSSEPDSVTYSITGVVNATGCEGHTEATVLVMPELTLDAASDIICSGGDVTLNLDELVNVESTFEWYALPNAGIQDATTNSVSNPDTSPVIQDVLTNLTNGDQTQFYFVIPTSLVGQCEASSGIQLEVEVLPPLAVEFEDFEANDTVAVCSGEPFSIFLGASTSSGVLSWRARPNPLVAGPTLAWQNNSAVISEVLTHNQTDLQFVVYESKVLASGCLSPIDSIIVQVNPIPALQPLEDLTFCDGVSTGGVTLSADVPGSSIHWSHSNAAIGLSSMGDAGDVPSWITQNTSDAPLSSMVDVAVNFENRGVVCTGSTESFTVTVLPVPQVDPLGDLSLCELELQPAIPLTTTVSGSEFQWSVSNGALGLTAGNSPSEISAFVASNPSMNVGYTTVTVTPIFPHPTPNASNCIGSSIAFQLEVFPAPQVLLDSDELCSGEAVAMDIATDLPSTWVWQANPLPEIQGETSSPAQSDSTIQDVLVNVTTSPVTVSYEVTPTSIAHGCVGQPAVFSALVNPLPQVDFVVLDQVLCDSVSASFENLSVGPLDFAWDFGGGDGIQQEDPTVVFPNIGVYDVTLVATNPMTGCVDSTQQSLEVFETPDPAFTWSDSSSCGPANVEFTATTLDASWDYLWDFGDGGTSDQIGVSGNLYAPGDCYDVSLTVTSPSGCTATQLVPELFCAFHQPNASFYPDPAVVTTLEPEVKFVNQSAFATNYFWDFGDGYTSFDEEPVHAYLDHGVFQVTLNAAIPDGCSESATAQVTVKPTLQVYVPNAFTADMDGLDDSWCPLLSDASLVTKYQLWVYNRWGDLVFSSETPGERWLGAYDGGAHFVPNDVYTWVLALDVPPNVAFDCAGASSLEGASSDCTLRGHVTILR